MRRKEKSSAKASLVDAVLSLEIVGTISEVLASKACLVSRPRLLTGPTGLRTAPTTWYGWAIE
jgi:hypothetical protein